MAIEQTKGCKLMCRTLDQSGRDVLALAFRRLIDIYTVTNTEITRVKQIALDTSPFSMYFIGASTIVYGSASQVGIATLEGHFKRIFGAPDQSIIPSLSVLSSKPFHHVCVLNSTALMATYNKTSYAVDLATGNNKAIIEWAESPKQARTLFD
jgi:hypothetical protein